MATEQHALAALERWHMAQGMRPYAEQMMEPEDDGFMAGYEAGHDELRDLVAEIISEVSGWSRDPLDTDHLIEDWRRRAG